jgi:hypothetical protein
MPPPPDLERRILDACIARGAERSLCPSEIARDLGGADWRAHMAPIRAAAARLAAQGRIRVTRRGAEVHAESAGGPIRLQLAAQGLRPRRSAPDSE